MLKLAISISSCKIRSLLPLQSYSVADGSRRNEWANLHKYRREDSAASAGRVYDRLSGRFPSNRIFIDVDNIAPGIDFVKAIEKSVGSCDVLISVVGKRWLSRNLA